MIISAWGRASSKISAGKVGSVVEHIAISVFLTWRIALSAGFCLWIPGGGVLDLNLLEMEKLLKDEGGLVVEALNFRYVPMVLIKIVGCPVTS
jgi:hypothetical protein